MAAKYGAYVHGVDLSVNMVTTALERAHFAHNGFKVASCFKSLSNAQCLAYRDQALPERFDCE